jgi:ABC-type nitrate/sulfonate/bicarbonate transport system substrate-binding protein
MRSTRKTFLSASAAVGAAAMLPARARADATPLRLISFASPALLPLYAGIEKGFYARENVALTLTQTTGSVYQFQHFAAGDFEIAMTAMDNVIAYDAGQGEAALATPADFVAILGFDNGFLRFYTRPDIASVADLKGKVLGVDAVGTGYAFVLRAMLSASGLHDDDYTFKPLGSTPARLKALVDGSVAATIISAPVDAQADALGMKRIGDVYATIGPYQGVVTAIKRSWLANNAVAANAFVRGTRAGIRWAVDPANHDEAQALLVSRGGMTPEVAATMFRLMLGPGGMSRTGEVDEAGVKTVLALRSRYATPPKTLAGPSAYVQVLTG